MFKLCLVNWEEKSLNRVYRKYFRGVEVTGKGIIERERSLILFS